jgi:hypothetical protein
MGKVVWIRNGGGSNKGREGGGKGEKEFGDE